jgi:hypothetical protein
MNASHDPPPTVSRMAMVTTGVSVSCLAYGASLALQRELPFIKTALALTVADGARPTYYLRVVFSLAIGAVAAAIGGRLAISERYLAWATAISTATSVLLACAFP